MAWALLRQSAATDDDDFIDDPAAHAPPEAGADTVMRVGLGAGNTGRDLTPRNGLKFVLVWMNSAGAPVNDAGTMDVQVAELATFAAPVGRRAFGGEVETAVAQNQVFTFEGITTGEFTVRCTNVTPVAATHFAIYAADY